MNRQRVDDISPLTPNCPLPSSLPSVNSSLLISHLESNNNNNNNKKNNNNLKKKKKIN